MCDVLRVFRVCEEAIVPKYSTKYSACFDLHACLVKNASPIKVKAFVPDSIFEKSVELKVNETFELIIPPKARVLVPTGLKFNIEVGRSIRLHPRSGLSFKSGLGLSNCEGVIDEDYFDEVFVSLINLSNTDQKICHADRVCQAELHVDNRCELNEIHTEPYQKTDRNGGFGSTGK